MSEPKTINAYVHLIWDGNGIIKWKWWCCPFLRVRMEGTTKTPSGAERAAKRTIERIGYKANVKIFSTHISTMKLEIVNGDLQ